MKQSLFVLFLFLVISTSAQPKKIDRTTNQLQGAVKSTSTVYFRTKEKFGELVKDFKEMSEVEEYNKDGLLTASEISIGKTSVTKTTYKYDNAGNLIEKKEDEDGEVILIQLLYNADGKETEVNTFNGKGALETKLKKKYDERGLLVSAILYNGNGSLREKELFKYNEKKQLSTKDIVDPKGDTTKILEYGYDEEGRLGIEIQLNQGNEISMEGAAYTYDSKGRIATKTRMPASGDKTTQTLEYDSFGNIIKEFTSTNNYLTDELTYDNRNNWVKMIRTMHYPLLSRKYIVERTVKYY
jgi:YD repeat-containing protein